MPPELPGTWFTPERLARFWEYVIWFMKFNMPIFMICMAVLVAYYVADMVIQVANETKKKHDKDDDDDIDVKYY